MRDGYIHYGASVKLVCSIATGEGGAEWLSLRGTALSVLGLFSRCASGRCTNDASVLGAF